MKNLLKKWAFVMIAIITLGIIYPSQTQAQGVQVSFQVFYDNLQPYGQWVNDPQYGYIWVPGNVDPGFQPYATNGYWIQTQYGNTWVSDYPWGWATFHYGRWFYDDFYGWVWVPDTVWGPAWVDWREGNGYYGWCPLGPQLGVSVSIPIFGWVFVSQRHFHDRRIYNYYEPRNRASTIFNNTRIINNTYVYNNRSYSGGPRPSEIERATKSKVRIYRVNDENRPGGAVIRNGSLNLYRPRVARRGDIKPSGAIDAATFKAQHSGRGVPSRGNQGNASRPQRTENPAGNPPNTNQERRIERRAQPQGQPVQTQPTRQERRQVPQQEQQGQAIPQQQQAPQRQERRQQPQRQQTPPRQERQQQQSQRQQAPPRQERQQQRESKPSRQERPQRMEQHSQRQRDGRSEERHH